ncbi:MAG TPA: hypothetical protein VGV40_10525 [Solirubrobacteraceae bacterium]|nr:hypothetical protein [Solirubrobacteraceae bacterium]
MHLLAHIAALVLAGYAILQLAGAGNLGNILLWFVGAVVLHDFVLLPLYSGLDQIARRVTTRRLIVFLRVPAGLSALLLLVYFPLILGFSEGTYTQLSGLPPEGYLGRWLLATGVLFAGSVVLLIIRATKAR